DSLVQGNVMHDNKCFGLQNYSSAGADTSRNTYKGNVSYHNGCGLVIAQGSGHTFEGNAVYEDGQLQRTPGAVVCCAPGTKVTNNLIVNNMLTGVAAYGDGGQDNVQVTGNIACGNHGGQITLHGASMGNNQISDTCAGDIMQKIATLQKAAGNLVSTLASAL